MKKRGYFILLLIVILFNGKQLWGKAESEVDHSSEFKEFFGSCSELVSTYWEERYFEQLVIDWKDETVLIDSQVVSEEISFDGQREEQMLPLGEVLDLIGGKLVINNDEVQIKYIGTSLSLQIKEDYLSMDRERYKVGQDNRRKNEIFVEFEFFEKELGLLIEENNDQLVMTSPYQTMRLIVKSSRNQFNNLETSQIISGPNDIFILQFDSIKDTVQALEYLKDQKWVDYVEPDYYVNGGISENGLIGPLSDKSYSHEVNEIGSVAPISNIYYYSWGVKHLEADKYREYLVNKNLTTSVTVGVVDTGIDFNHSFLKDRILNNGYDFVNGYSYPYDDHGHGTHVAGTVVDMTQELNINILPIKVLNYKGNGTTLNAGNGIKYAVMQKADIINFSIEMNAHSQYIDNIILDAINVGVTVVIAAGNSNMNTTTQCPSHLTEAIIVSAIDSNNQKAYFSNYGNSIDVAAPGVDVVSSYPGGRYAYMSGTSMAAPHITAIAAMYKLENSNLSPRGIESLIKKNTKDIGKNGVDQYFGHGIPSLSKAIKIYSSVFPDIEVGKWYTSHIEEFASLGYISGYEDGTFKPQNPITRAEFVKIVNKAFKLSNKYKPVNKLPFTDLDSQWKKDELKLALAAGYITPATEFRPNEPINRQEAAKIIGYLLGDKLTNHSNWEFVDSDQIATWAQDYVAGLVEVGVLSKNESFRPKDSITRAEAVKMLNIARRL